MALGAPSCRPAQHDATTATSNQLGHCGQQAPFLTPGQVTESVPILDAPPPLLPQLCLLRGGTTNFTAGRKCTAGVGGEPPEGALAAFLQKRKREATSPHPVMCPEGAC